MVGRSELAHRIAARGTSPAQAGHAVQAVLDEVTAALAGGERVIITGFGTFKPVARPAHAAHNPRTGAPMQIAASTTVRFQPSARLRAAVDAGPIPLGAAGTLPTVPSAQTTLDQAPADGPGPAPKAATTTAGSSSKATAKSAPKRAASKKAASKEAAPKEAAPKGKVKGVSSKDAKKSGGKKSSKKDAKKKGSKG